jgi:hypothetical protein
MLVLLVYLSLPFFASSACILTDHHTAFERTLEYNHLRWDHPQIHTVKCSLKSTLSYIPQLYIIYISLLGLSTNQIQVADFDAAVRSGTLKLDFDQVWSFSALEHDGPPSHHHQLKICQVQSFYFLMGCNYQVLVDMETHSLLLRTLLLWTNFVPI